MEDPVGRGLVDIARQPWVSATRARLPEAVHAPPRGGSAAARRRADGHATGGQPPHDLVVAIAIEHADGLQVCAALRGEHGHTRHLEVHGRAARLSEREDPLERPRRNHAAPRAVPEQCLHQGHVATIVVKAAVQMGPAVGPAFVAAAHELPR